MNPASSLRWLLGCILFTCAACTQAPAPDDAPDEPPAKDASSTPVDEDDGSEPSKGGPGNNPGDQTTDPTGATTIRVHYPAGKQKIGLRGPTAPLASDKTTPLFAKADDTWELALGTISQPIEFKPMLDDSPARGPNYRVAPGQSIDVYPYFKATKGEVTVKWPDFAAKALPGSKRSLRVYTPPSYGENTRARYPVLYVHDGQTAFAASETIQQSVDGTTQIDVAMDQGVDSGKIAEAIVIAIDNDSDALTDLMGTKRTAELTPTKSAEMPSSGKGPQYAAMIADEIKPMVDAEYRTKPGREDTFTLGASLGGLISAYIAFDRPDVFGAFGSQSGSIWWDKQVIVGQAKTAIAKPSKPARIYVDYGDHEVQEPDYTKQLVAPTDVFLKTLRDGGYVDGKTLLFTLGASPASHNSRSWSKRIPGALSFLIGPGR